MDSPSTAPATSTRCGVWPSRATATSRPSRCGLPATCSRRAAGRACSARALFGDIGLFDEDFFAYFEDVDLSFRAQLAGHRVYYCADAVAYHDQGATSRTMSGFATTAVLPQPAAAVGEERARPGCCRRSLPRFVLVYTLMVLHQFRRGQGGRRSAAWRAVGRPRGPRPASATGDPAIPPVDAASIRALLWPGLPPGMRVLRGRLRRPGTQ